MISLSEFIDSFLSLGSSIVNKFSIILNKTFEYCFPSIQSKKLEQIFANSIKVSSSSYSMQFIKYVNNSFLVLLFLKWYSS